ncbi:hypothetical protein CBR_g48708 [Chara braunii]|uniref:Zinc finger PHD-type domain-containing protein n=1 Tax=Chara braunii TaxID=69332 RepID=A0A388K4L9_CHABU|nr:hypothetical protein CBR_g48708 [Chara braunii]|eukprot:GBG64959.1 hypothetical protein CBR_g48708 [Chara braunii]
MRRKHRVAPSFPVGRFGEEGYPAEFSGPFRTNIRSLLYEFAVNVTSDPSLFLPEGVSAWTISLEGDQDNNFKLYIFEERIEETKRLYCDHCRIIGWGGHPVTTKRYHFIIPVDQTSESTGGIGIGRGRKRCRHGWNFAGVPTSKCEKCKEEELGRSGNDYVTLDSQCHLLHGLLHANGYGHLLRVNGREGGSKYLCGTQLMDLFDRICSMLCVRRVSVQDVSKKAGLDFCLLHAVAYGQPWYGKWGYKFGRGSFNTTEGEYLDATRRVWSLPLDVVIKELNGADEDLNSIINAYSCLSSERLCTLGDLMRCLLIELRRAKKGQRNTGDECPIALASESPTALASTTKEKDEGKGGWESLDCIKRKMEVDRNAPVDGVVKSPKVTVAAAGPCDWKQSRLEQDCKQRKMEGALERQDCKKRKTEEGRKAPVNGVVKSPKVAAAGPCRWTQSRLEQASQVLVAVLRRRDGQSWISRPALREFARSHVGDTGLLDFVLKGMADLFVGDKVVKRRFNSRTRMYEYLLEDVEEQSGLEVDTVAEESDVLSPSDGSGMGEGGTFSTAPGCMARDPPNLHKNPAAETRCSAGPFPYPAARRRVISYKDVARDLSIVYRKVLGRGKESGMLGVFCKDGRLFESLLWKDIRKAVVTILDTKLFVKDFCEIEGIDTVGDAKVEVEPELDVIRVMCSVSFDDEPLRHQERREVYLRRHMEEGMGRDFPPPELVVLPVDATIADLKRKAGKAFSEVYMMMKGFEVTDIPALATWSDDTLLTATGVIGSEEEGEVLILGYGIDYYSLGRYEGGIDEWVVDCKCGTVDDDGERMVACDSCEVWQHTRCVGISDASPPPDCFVCRACQGQTQTPIGGKSPLSEISKVDDTCIQDGGGSSVFLVAFSAVFLVAFSAVVILSRVLSGVLSGLVRGPSGTSGVSLVFLTSVRAVVVGGVYPAVLYAEKG